MKTQPKGVTLIELVLSIVIVSIALLGTLICINTVVFSSSDPILTEQAASIADSYLQEILTKNFPVASCPVATRVNYANICNYNGLNQAPTNLYGNLISGLGGYTVNVTVDTSTANLGGLTGSTAVARIDVRVSHAGMNPITLSAYVSN